MRAVTRKIMTAFLERRASYSRSTWTDGRVVRLFGNRIAWRKDNGDICMTLAGWNTTTTRERLNGLCDLLYGTRPFHQVKGLPFYDDDQIDTRTVITVHNIIPVELDLAV